MTQTTELLRSMRCMLKLYEAYTLPVCRENGLSQTEADVLAFLDNNPGLDTASDIVELRMIPAQGGAPVTLAELFGGQGTINVNSWAPDSKKFAYVSYSVD